MQSMQQDAVMAFYGSLGLLGEMLGSPCESLELSDVTSSQAESDLSLALSDEENDNDNQRRSKSSSIVACNRRGLAEDQLKKSSRDVVDNQDEEDHQPREDDASSSDPSIADSEVALVRDDSSLSLSKSSSSDDAGLVEWLQDLSSESSQTDPEGAADAVLISSDDDKGDRASTSSDAHWLSDSDSKSSSTYEPEWAEDPEDEQLWNAFDEALLIYTVDETSPNEVVDISHLVAHDEDYEASVSASSLDESDDESFDLESRPAFHQRLSVGYDTASDVDSVASLPSTSDRYSSCISSLAFLSSEERHDQPDPLLDPLSSSCDEDAQTKGSRWIENIPANTHNATPDTMYCHETDKPSGCEQPLIWRQSEYIVAEGYGVRQQRKHLRVFASDKSIDSLSEDEDEAPTSPTRWVMSPPQQNTLHQADLHEMDAYVGYNDLAGVFERHAPRHPSLIIDLGCGTSRLSAELVFHGHRFVYGVDRDLAAIDFQRRRSVASELKAFVQFLPMNISNSLVFPDKCSDLIVSKATLDEIATRCLCQREPHELLEALKETIRCLKSGGILIVVAFQDPYAIDGEDVDGSSAIPDDASPVERASYRLQVPWWQWADVKGLLHHELSLIAQYELGRPSRSGLGKTKPYRALVWRRKETRVQCLRRLAGTIRVQKQMEREYAARIQQKLWETERRNAELEMVSELRQMIVEDECSAKWRMQHSQVEAANCRAKRREAFYAALLEEERHCMVLEDGRSTRRRDYETQLETIAKEMLAAIVELVLQTATAASVGSPTVTTSTLSPSLEPVQKVKSVHETSSIDIPPAQSNATSVAGWIREEMERIVDAAVASAASKVLHQPVQRRRRGQTPTKRTVETAPINQAAKTSAMNETPPIGDTSECPTQVDVHEVAQQTVDWIVSCALQAARSPTKRPNELTSAPPEPAECLSPPTTASEAVVQAAPHATVESEPQSASVEVIATATVESFPTAQPPLPESPVAAPHNASTEATPYASDSVAQLSSQAGQEVLSSGASAEELVVVRAVLEAIVTQVSQHVQ